MKLYQYIELQSIDKANYSTVSDYYIECVAVYLDLPTNEVEEYDYQEVIGLYNELSKKIRQANKGVDSFHLLGVDFYKKSFNSLSLAEFIDLENYLQNRDEASMLAVIYRKKIQDEDADDFDEDKYENYGNYVSKRVALFSELDAFDLLGAVQEYIIWRDEFFKNYSSFFSLGKDEEADVSELKGAEKREYMQMLQQEKMMQQYSYEKLIMDLAGNDITKTKDVLALPVIYVFNIKSMIKVFSDV